MDLNGDGVVNKIDLAHLAIYWKQTNARPDQSSVSMNASSVLRMLDEWHQESSRLQNLLTGMEEIVVPLPGLVENAVKLNLVHIPAGTFMMGSPLNEKGYLAGIDWPQHRVTISKDFYLGKFEITQAQWLTLMEMNPSSHTRDLNQPVNSVTWNDCQIFIQRLNQLGRGTFRLPTEAEWEYACRAGTATAFAHGSGITCVNPFDPCGEHIPYMWWFANSGSLPWRVGRKLSNSWGLFDMHGNVNEWCSDYWQNPSNRTAQINPTGPSVGTDRVIRGGGFLSPDYNCRSANRSGVLQDDTYDDIGFRIAADSLNLQ